METLSGLEGAEVPPQPGMDFSEAGFLQELQVRRTQQTRHFPGEACSCAWSCLALQMPDHPGQDWPNKHVVT